LHAALSITTSSNGWASRVWWHLIESLAGMDVELSPECGGHEKCAAGRRIDGDHTSGM
jgi:hypothetical protein